MYLHLFLFQRGVENGTISSSHGRVFSLLATGYRCLSKIIHHILTVWRSEMGVIFSQLEVPSLVQCCVGSSWRSLVSYYLDWEVWTSSFTPLTVFPSVHVCGAGDRLTPTSSLRWAFRSHRQESATKRRVRRSAGGGLRWWCGASPESLLVGVLFLSIFIQVPVSGPSS